MRSKGFQQRAFVYAWGALLFLLACVFHLFERLTSWATQHDMWYAGELVITGVLMLAALEFLALRRLRDLVHESGLREQVERELKGKEEYFRTLIENSSDGICVLREDGTILYVAPSVERLLGRKTESLIGKSFLKLVSADDTVNTAAVLSRLMDNPGYTTTFEARVRHQSDEWRTIEAVAQNLVNGVLGSALVVNFRDVTERKEAEERKLRMEQQVQLAGRLAALGEITAGVAHELSNPLTAVQLYAQHLASKKDLDETIKRDLDRVYAESQRATKISENLLSFARKHEPDRRLISLNEVIEKSVELHMYRLRVNNIDLVLQLDSDLPRIMADFHQMQQVVVNMVTNGEQAITERRRVGSLSIKTERAGETVQMLFVDNGPGIDAATLDKIFDPFFTTKEDGKGTGLGLSICRRIVEQHGGRLSATSEVGKGTTFVVELPIGAAAEMDTDQADPVKIEQENDRSSETRTVGERATFTIELPINSAGQSSPELLPSTHLEES